jgi:hypothetical protein
MKSCIILIFVFMLAVICLDNSASGDEIIYITQWKTNVDGKIQVVEKESNKKLSIDPPAIPLEGLPAHKNTDSFSYKIIIKNVDYLVRMDQVGNYEPAKQKVIRCSGNNKSLSTAGMGDCE